MGEQYSAAKSEVDGSIVRVITIINVVQLRSNLLSYKSTMILKKVSVNESRKNEVCHYNPARKYIYVMGETRKIYLPVRDGRRNQSHPERSHGSDADGQRRNGRKGLTFCTYARASIFGNDDVQTAT